MEEKEVIGEVTHYFPKIGVGIIKLHKELCAGENIEFSIHTGHEQFTQTVHSMQMEHTAVQHAKAGQEIGMKVDKPVHAGDKVFRA